MLHSFRAGTAGPEAQAERVTEPAITAQHLTSTEPFQGEKPRSFAQISWQRRGGNGGVAPL